MEALLGWIDNLPGPQFLGLYASLIATTLAACFVALRYTGGGRPSAAEQLPSNPDPYEVAYLRGGRRAVQSLVLLDLAHRGYIKQSASASKKPYLRQVDGPPDPFKLSEPQREIFRAIGEGREPLGQVVSSASFREALDRLVKPYETSSRDRFVVPPLKRLLAFLVGATVVIGVGGFKLVDALAEGRENIAFLTVLGVGGLIALGIVTAGRLNAAGRRHLNRLQLGYAGAEELQLAFALLGPAALVGSANVAYASMLGVDPNTGRGTWGSSCGSSCGGGDGGGGGCGGCGGE